MAHTYGIVNTIKPETLKKSHVNAVYNPTIIHLNTPAPKHTKSEPHNKADSVQPTPPIVAVKFMETGTSNNTGLKLLVNNASNKKTKSPRLASTVKTLLS